ncbi:MAG: DNA polymerase IV [Candidatus Omnitrophota bacterium]|jgi:DNA polymerase-4/DNA polymerase V
MSASTINFFPASILHVDCDAFFSSVEQALRPELKGRPVVTGRERGIVACASYEAKALGVKRPMRIFEARKVCRDLVCLPSDYETYSLYSRRMFEILRRFTPAVEEYSIDEAFADLSGLRRLHRTGYAGIAWKIKEQVRQELALTVSAGLAASKILSKMASKEKKPDGFTVFRTSQLDRILDRMDLERVCGFGPNTVALLRKNGVRFVRDYTLRPEAWARGLLGKTGAELWHELRGESVYAVETAPKDDYASISKCKTFTPPSGDRDFVRAQLLRNLESAFIKLRRHGLRARSLTVFLRDREFETVGLEAAWDRSTASTVEAAGLAASLFDRIFRPGFDYRLTGVVLSKLESDRTVQYGLFDDVPRLESLRAVDRVIDSANAVYGKHALHLGTGLWIARHRQHLTERGDLPSRKTELLKGETFRQRLNVPVWQIKV